MIKKPLIIDTDPGIDDALALLLLYKFKDEFNIKLFCSTAGNIPIETATNNLKYFVKNYFNGAKVAKGSESPLVKPKSVNAEYVHGVSGLGHFKIPNQNYPTLPNSVEAMYETIKESKTKVILLCLGPLTNISKLLIIHPDIRNNIEKIYTMIGSVKGKGNITPYAEFNSYFDPEAFDLVVKSEVPLVLNPMELGFESRAKKAEFIADKITPTQKLISEVIAGSYESMDPTAFAIFDPLSVLALVKPEFFEFKKCWIDVETNGEKSGQSIINEKPDGIHCYQVIKDTAKTTKFILDTLKSIE